MIVTGVTTALVGYLVGSFPVAYLVGRRVAGVDVRFAGEGNVGARNVFHVVGPRWGMLVFAGDFAKGATVATIFRDAPVWQLAVAGAAVLVGHGFPVWLDFVGGKGLSTAGGMGAALMPWAAVVAAASAAVVWAATRRFLPTTVVAILAAVLAAPLTGVDVAIVALVVWLFVLCGVKRAIDEPRMRTVEAATGWDRTHGLRP